jgi:uncharacterized protein
MWVAALIIWIMLGSGAASAFECASVKLPSSIVICSDPELTRLADERQEAINEARGRLGEGGWPALWEDQKAWVRSYATACGVPPDRPPPIPVPAEIRACFKRAAETRIAYIRAYNPAPDQPTLSSNARLERIGPGFDCGKAAAPLALMICSDPGLSQLDFRFNQAYWALFQRLGPAGQAQHRRTGLRLHPRRRRVRLAYTPLQTPTLRHPNDFNGLQRFRVLHVGLRGAYTTIPIYNYNVLSPTGRHT